MVYVYICPLKLHILNSIIIFLTPGPVNNIQVDDINGTSVRVTWEPLDIPEVTGYRVYYPLSESRKRQSGRTDVKQTL